MQIRNIFVAMALMAIGSHAAPLDARAGTSHGHV